MKRFKNLLAIADDPENADQVLIEAYKLAERNDADLTILGVVDEPVTREPIVLEDGSQVSVVDLLASDQMTELEELTTRLGIAGAELEVAVGVAFVEVIKRAQRGAHDLVMVGDGRDDHQGRRSSLAIHLLRKCPVPVWVETSRGDTSRDVAVAVGPFLGDEEYFDLNAVLIELGSSLAALRGGALHVVHAWRLEGETQLRRPRARQPAAYVDELVAIAHREAALNLEALVGRIEDRGLVVEVHLVKGAAEEVVPSAIDSIRPGVLVMGTLARAGLRGRFIGNTAENVLREVQSSLLAIKPEGFESPVS